MDDRINPLVISLVSGKGGTGKSTIAINLAMALANTGKRIFILDANFELPSIATLLNINPTYNITDLIEGRKSIREVVYNGPHGINLILGCNKYLPIKNLSSAQHFGIVNAFNSISKEIDILIVDTAPGINNSTINFALASQVILVATTGEPTALAGANALINTLNISHSVNKFKIIINRVHDEYEGLKAFKKLQNLNTNNPEILLNYTGHIHEHNFAHIAANKAQFLYKNSPKSEFSQDIKKLSQQIDLWPQQETLRGHIEFFVDHIVENGIKG